MWLDISYSDNILLFWHLLHGHFASRWSPVKASFRKFFAISNHSTECVPLSLNLSYIAHRSLAIFNIVGSLHKRNLVFTVKVSSLQQELGQSEFIVYAFSSSQNDWNYVCLSNLIGTKNATSYFWLTRGQKQLMTNFVPMYDVREGKWQVKTLLGRICYKPT
jgi:hypothetical protein